jgi:hypothetical protein
MLDDSQLQQSMHVVQSVTTQQDSLTHEAQVVHLQHQKQGDIQISDQDFSLLSKGSLLSDTC